MNPYFRIDKFGNLYTKEIYIEGDVPVFFSCTDEDGLLYFVSASVQTKEYVSWIATEVSEDRICDVLNDRISLKNIYVNSEKNRIYFIKRQFHSGVTTFDLFQRDQIDSDLLPSDEPLELCDEEKLSYLPSGKLNISEFASQQYSSISKIHLENDSICFNHAVPAGLFGELITDLQELKASLLLTTREVAGRVTQKLKKSTQEYMIAVNPGSFEVLLQSEQSVVLDSSLERIYSTLDKLLSFNEDNDDFRNFLETINITVIKKYKSVLDDLISLGQKLQIDTTFPPISGEAKQFSTSLTRSDIAVRRQLLEKLIINEDQPVQFRGELAGIDAIKRTFSFTFLDTKEPISGKITRELAEAVMNHEDLYQIPSIGTLFLTETTLTDVNEKNTAKKYSLTQFIRD